MKKFGAGEAVAVLLPRPVPGPFDYLPPPDCDPSLVPGEYLRVPLRGGEEVGVVWGPGSGKTPPSKIRAARARIDLPPMSEELRSFLHRAAAYTLTPLGTMLSLSLHRRWLEESRSALRFARRPGPMPARMTEARMRVLDAVEAAGVGPLSAAELARRADCSVAVVTGMVRAGMLEAVAADLTSAGSFESLSPVPAVLEPAQGKAAGELVGAVEAGGFETILLQGVTGSGKTEVYLEAVAANLAAGRQTLVLLPEIALTTQFVRRLEARFGATPAVWHSRLGLAARRRVWQMVARGEARIVVGARSALFLPFRNLGLVIVDEEHDTSYKQEDGVLYHARDMAVLRAQAAAAPVVLATATPSLETYANVCRGRYRRLRLPERYGGAVLPEVRALDLRQHRPEPRCWLAPPLVEAIRETLEESRQALLFLNRRGYAPLMLCRHCGHRLGCPDCDAWLVLHHGSSALRCHQCGRTEPAPVHCPECGEPNSLAACGPGVERIAEEVATRFPEARQAVLSSDTIGGGEALLKELAAVEQGEVDIVIGTQIVAKGHNFPHLSLVGVIDADLCLRSADLRAGERTFQVVRQVTGRAGRVGGTSRALLQTADPEHPVIQAILAGDEEAFLAQIEAERREAGSPPYGRYVAVIVSGINAADVRRTATDLAAAGGTLEAAGIRLYGPAPAPFARLRALWRWRLLAAAPRGVRMQSAVAAWRNRVTPPRGVRVALDVDPQSFL